MWVAVCVCLVACIAAEETHKPSDHKHSYRGRNRVIDLTASNFADTVSKGKWLIAFNAPWCEKCKELEKDMTTIVNKVFETGVHVGRVNAEAYRELAERFHVEEFPTVELVQYDRRGKVPNFAKYNGPITAAGIADFGRNYHVPVYDSGNSMMDHVYQAGNDAWNLMMNAADSSGSPVSSTLKRFQQFIKPPSPTKKRQHVLQWASV